MKYASQSLLCHALQTTQRALPFGTTFAAQVLGHRDVKFPESRSLTGRLLYWDHLRDQVSYILCPPDTPDGDALVYGAGFPVRLPPGRNVDEIAHKSLMIALRMNLQGLSQLILMMMMP